MKFKQSAGDEMIDLRVRVVARQRFCGLPNTLGIDISFKQTAYLYSNEYRDSSMEEQTAFTIF